MRQATGFIEMRGLSAAITAADIALKAANVELIGLELSRGMGYAVVKIQGDVGAVKAAVEAATAARETRDYFVAKDVIPRPSLDLDQIIYSEETQGLDQEVDKEEKLPLEAGPEEEKDRSVEKEENLEEEVLEEEALEEEALEEEALEEEVLEEKVLEEVTGGLGGESDQAQEASQESLEGLEDREPTCNLCLDPACPRKKGEPRVDCIHFEEDDWRK